MVLTVISACFLTTSLSSQITGPVYREIDNLKRSYQSEDSLFKTPELRDGFISRRFDFSLPEDQGDFLLNPDGLNRYYPGAGRFRDYRISEVYPGSSRFYARRPSLIRSPYSSRFVTRPGEGIKYHLIIKDPLQNLIHNDGLVKLQTK